MAGSVNSHEGRVEVYIDGSWRTMCNNGWDFADAQVICRQIGYDKALDVTYDSYRFGQSHEPTWLVKLDCYNESSLNDCRTQVVGIHECDNYKDPGVVCGLGKPIYLYTYT